MVTIAEGIPRRYVLRMDNRIPAVTHLTLEPLAGPDQYLAATYWQEDSYCHHVVHLTATRVLRSQTAVGPIRIHGSDVEAPFFARVARMGLQSASKELLNCPDEPTLKENDLTAALRRAVAWTRTQAPLRLRSPFVQEGNRPPRWGLTHVAFLYDTYSRLADPAPVEAIARATGMTVSAARSKVHRARREGLLTPTRRGEPGGRLTEKGQEAVQRDPYLDDMKSFYFELIEES